MGEYCKMNKKTKISLLMALLMIVSTATTVGTVTANEGNFIGALEFEETLDVTKEVWNGTHWVDEIVAEIGDTVQFRITITYSEPLNETSGYRATDIVVKDTLPDCLNYTNDVKITYGTENSSGESSVNDKIVYWNLTEDYPTAYPTEEEGGIQLYLEPNIYDIPDTVQIEFNTTVVDYGVNVNKVNVTATEHCSGEPLSGNATATVIVEEEPCETRIELEKTVWNETEWAEHIDGLTIGDIVKFKIEITYLDECETGYEILNMVVDDYLPCCLEYNETLEITSTGEVDETTPIVSPDGKIVTWEWEFDNHVVLDGINNTLTIIFTADFVNYCEEVDENLAYVEAWGCSGPTYTDEDNATVDCRQDDPYFEKTVWNGSAWTHEIETTEGQILRFRLKLQYFGLEDLRDIRIYDEMSCILEYANNLYSNIEDIEDYINVSEDKKQMWWNLTGLVLEDGDYVIIEFDALVTGQSSGDCPLCECEDAYNYAEVWGRIGCTQEPNFNEWDEVTIFAEGNCRPSAPGVSGDSSAELGEEIEIKVRTTDPDGDRVAYLIDWGDGTGMAWTVFFNSGQEVTFIHTYAGVGEYDVYARAKDENESLSDWSYYPFTITITEEEEEEEEEKINLGITLPTSVKGEMSATIKNKGDDDLAAIDWEITITGGILGKVDATKSGAIDLNSGKSKDVDTGHDSVGFGFGRVAGTVEVSYSDYEKSVEFHGFLIGKTIISIHTE